ncbi:hypothetical protein ACLB1Q_17915 [Escherichia coli]
MREPDLLARRRNATIFDDAEATVDHADGDYADEPMIDQVFQPLPGLL